MRGRGITYDTGFTHSTSPGESSRRHFDATDVERDLRAVRDELHCTAVRVSGGDPDRIELTAAVAVDLGLEVWVAPYPLEATTEQMLVLFADCAERAERLRRRGAQIVFVTGAELSLMNPGFLPGETIDERMDLLNRPDQVRAAIGAVGARVNRFLSQAVAVVRERFHGPVTYASIPLDQVDWTPFDIVSLDLYRSAEIADGFAELFAEGMRALAGLGKPVAITEFGTASYRGAGDLGARGLEVLEFDPQTHRAVRLKGEYERDEAGQADYLRELLEVFDANGVDSAFVFIFALWDMPHRRDGDPRDDLDLASYGIVKVVDDQGPNRGPRWEPKAAFGALAQYYRRP
jgi:hypothetical protein